MEQQVIVTRPKTPKHERGAVLIVSLILLTLLSVLVLSGSRSTALQENMTANFNNQIVANMAAEAGAADLIQWLLNNYSADLSEDALLEGFGAYNLATAQQLGNSLGYYYLDQDRLTLDGTLLATVVGVAATADSASTPQAHAYLRLQLYLGQSPTKPYKDAIIGCEGIALKGSGHVDSYDSRNGAYNSVNRASNATVRTTEAGADIELSGDTPIYGETFSTGDLSISGSATVYGDITADNNVTLKSGNGALSVNVSAGGDITFDNNVTLYGDARANGDIVFNKYQSFVDGNAQAGGEVIATHNAREPDDHVTGTLLSGINPDNPPISPSACDPLDIKSVVQELGDPASTGDMTIGRYPKRQWVIRPPDFTSDDPSAKAGVSYYDETWNVQDWVSDEDRSMPTMNVMGEEKPVLVVDDLTFSGGTGELRISGGDVVIYVKGDFDMSGNNNLVIDSDSSLTVITDGSFDLAGSVDVNADSSSTLNDNGDTRFAVYSTFDQSQAGNAQPGIKIRAANDMAGTFYAPLSDVSLSGSADLYGAVRGRDLEISGAAGVHYDEALGNVEIGGSEGDQRTAILSWKGALP